MRLKGEHRRHPSEQDSSAHFPSLPFGARRTYTEAEMKSGLFAADCTDSSKRAPPLEGRRDGARRLRDAWRWLGTSGEATGTGGVACRSLWRRYPIVAIAVA